MKKRIISAFLAILLTVSMITIPASAYSIDGLTVKSGLDYSSMESFSDDGYCVVRKDTDGDGYDEYGLIDSNGNEVITPKYDYMADPVEGMARVGLDIDGNSKTGWKFNSKGIDKFGFVDMGGREVVPLIYDAVQDFSDGMAAVSTKHQRQDDGDLFTIIVSNTGFVDKTGELVIPLIYEGVGGAEVVSDAGVLGDHTSTKIGFSEGLASVQNKDGKWGVIDKQGNTVIPFTYDKIGGFSEGLASVGVNDKWGFIDKQGKMVIPTVYDSVHDFSEGFACVSKRDPSSANGYFRGFVDKQGTLIGSTEYGAMGTKFCEGLIKVATASHDSSGNFNGWKWGFLNTKGDIAVPMKYFSVNTFSEGLSAVDLPDGFTGSTSSAGTHKYAIIDKQGNIVTPWQTEIIGAFSEGLATVGLSRYHYIDKTGADVIPMTANQYGCSVFSAGVAVAYDNKSGRYSIIKNPLSTSQAPTTSPTVPADTTPSFTDTPSWCAKEAAWAAEKGITNGYGGSTTFAPNVDCTQAQILTFLWRAEDKPQAAKAPITTAVSYQDAVNWAYGKKMIDDSFKPDAPCTRSQAVQYIWKALGELKAKEKASFSDVAVNAPYADAVSWAVKKGVTKGYGGADTFAPDRVCTRSEIVCFLYRAYN